MKYGGLRQKDFLSFLVSRFKNHRSAYHPDSIRSSFTSSRNFSSHFVSSFGIFTFVFAVTLITAYLYSPVVKTNAEEDPGTASPTRFLPTDPYMISITSPSRLKLDLTPTPGGIFKSGSVDVTVETTSTRGYTLTMSTANENNALKSGAAPSSGPSVITSIPSISSNTTASSFPMNNWGYSNDDATYRAIPKLSNPAVIRKVNTPVNTSNKTTKVTFAAKLNNNVQAGNYKSLIVFTATSNTPPPPVFSGITTMQEMTSAICAAETTPTKEATEFTRIHTADTSLIPRTTLKDVRNNQDYLVSKLADGNCWMSQNLELKLTPAKHLTSDTTDLNTKTIWTPDNITQETTGGTSWGSGNDNGARSYDPPSTEDYRQKGTVVAGQSSRPGNPDYEWERTGIYYNWVAATAGSGASAAANTVVNDSICPKGWKLPDNEGSKSFHNLLYTAYDFGSFIKGEELKKSPFHNLYVGYYYDDNVGNISGSYGVWSSTSGSSNQAYFLWVDSYVNTHYLYSHQSYGYSIRCVAR